MSSPQLHDDAAAATASATATLLPSHLDLDHQHHKNDVHDDGNVSGSGSSSYALAGYTLLLLLSAVGNSFFFKMQIDAFSNYSYFLNQVTTVVYIPVFFCLVMYQRVFTDSITPEMLAFPKRKFFVMGMLDSLSGLFMTFGGVHTSGSLQALLLQGLIPITMVLTYIMLHERYNRRQYGGAALIIIGVVVALLPSALQPQSGGGSANVLFWNMVFLCCVVPQALSSVFKETAFTQDMDVNYLQYWVALWQFFFGIVCAPLNSLRMLGAAYVPLDQVPSTLTNGFRCMIGVNSRAGDHCGGAWIPLVCYLGFNILYNVSTVLVIKHGSANMMNFAMTLRLPILQVVFALPLPLQHRRPDEFHALSIVGVLLIVAGLSLYRVASSAGAGVPPANVEEAIQVVPGALEAPAFTLRRKRHVLHRAPQAIRSGFYARLGIGGSASPATPAFRRSFRA